jgi:hypothetical protein
MPISPGEDSGARVRLDMSSFPRSIPWSLFGVLRLWYRVSALRLLIAEFRNLFHHIEVALEIRAWELRGSKGSVHVRLLEPLAFQSQSCRRAYSHYMQQLQTEHPRMTILDLLLLGKAWKAGSEWNDPAGILQNQDNLSSSLPAGQDELVILRALGQCPTPLIPPLQHKPLSLHELRLGWKQHLASKQTQKPADHREE